MQATMTTTMQSPNQTVTVDGSSSTDSSDASARITPKKPLTLPKFCALDQSLASAMMGSRRSAMKSLQIQFAAQVAQSRKIKLERKDAPEEKVEPMAKRRRFQRRNSKTAAMLFSSMSSIVSAVPNTTHATEARDGSCKAAKEVTDDVWDGGLEIAEDLVRHLKLRRQQLSNKGV